MVVRLKSREDRWILKEDSEKIRKPNWDRQVREDRGTRGEIHKAFTGCQAREQPPPLI